jgi:hypothetical protein
MNEVKRAIEQEGTMSAPCHTFRITALALIFAGVAAASITPTLARGLGGGGVGGGPSMGSINIGPRMNSGISNPADRTGGNQNVTPASAKKGKKGTKPKEKYLEIKIETPTITSW